MSRAEIGSVRSQQPVAGNRFLGQLRKLALAGLPRMFDAAEGRFYFRLRRTAAGVVAEGHSDRYTAITLLGLAGERAEDVRVVLHGLEPGAVWRALARRAAASPSIGDVALTLWAGLALGEAEREPLVCRLLELRPAEGTHPTVELAWTLSALVADADAPVGELRDRLARRLVEAQVTRSGAFPHVLGSPAGLRGHVACFADLVYPIQALSICAERAGSRAAAAAACRTAELIVRRQGPAGQWWWHFDVRSGEIVERYPVYAVHQDAMAPMALMAAHRAIGLAAAEPLERGLEWLAHSPELGGRSLVDEDAGLIWRKVARREPGKLSRGLQAVASRVHPSSRLPALDRLFPPSTIDHEDRPYHLGWLLYAFPARRLPL